MYWQVGPLVAHWFKLSKNQADGRPSGSFCSVFSMYSTAEVGPLLLFFNMLNWTIHGARQSVRPSDHSDWLFSCRSSVREKHRTDVLLGRRVSSVGLVCQANFAPRHCRREPTPQSAFLTTSSLVSAWCILACTHKSKNYNTNYKLPHISCKIENCIQNITNTSQKQIFANTFAIMLIPVSVVFCKKCGN